MNGTNAKQQWSVTSHKLSDGSDVFAIRVLDNGCAAFLDCENETKAYELCDLLNKEVCEVRLYPSWLHDEQARLAGEKARQALGISRDTMKKIQELK